MDDNIQNILQIDEKFVWSTIVDGERWIALRPICNAFDIDWDAEYDRIRSITILNEFLAPQLIEVSNDTKLTFCLPEHLFYGWALQLECDHPQFLQYKAKCYLALGAYFTGSIRRVEQPNGN